MKTLKTILAIIMFVTLNGIGAYASQDTTITIKTSAQCESCKKRIENSMSFEKGVKKVALDVDTKVLTLTYDAKKTSAEKLKTAVTKIGYDADELPADKKAYGRLPKCCKKEEIGEKH
jgi:copper chaperone CopZ